MTIFSPRPIYTVLLGPKRARFFILEAAARCVKPESFPIKNLHNLNNS